MVDSGATGHFNSDEDDLTIFSTASKTIGSAFGQTEQTVGTALLPLNKLRDKARHTDILPALSENSLLSVPQLADNGYTTIFHPFDEGVTVHDTNDVHIQELKTPVLQGWLDSLGLWRYR